MGCVPAPACRQALADATAMWPGRDRGSDGICGDASHQAKKSDHNQGNAFDLTHDPTHGVDCHLLAESVRADKRVKYVIWNRRIWNPSVSPNWRSYGGSNPHTAHMHVSIHDHGRDDLRPWPWTSGHHVPLEEDDMFDDGARQTLEDLRAQLASLADTVDLRTQVQASTGGALFCNGTEHRTFVTAQGNLQRWVWVATRWECDLDEPGFDPASVAVIRQASDHGRWLWHEVSARTTDGRVGRVVWTPAEGRRALEIVG